MYKRLDKVVALRSTNELTKGKVYTVLGVSDKGLLLIATDDKQGRRYFSKKLFEPEEKHRAEEDERIRRELEERGL